MAAIDVTEGWTGRIDLQLQADGTAYDLTGLEVAFVARTPCGEESIFTTSGAQFEQVDSTCGIVGFTPTTSDLTVDASPYVIQVRVTSGTAKVYFPNGAGDLWTIHAQ